jgi:hypothetical protein
MLYHNTLPEYLGLIYIQRNQQACQGWSKVVIAGRCDSYLIHLEETRMNFVPVGDADRYRMQLGGVLMERSGLDLVYTHDRHEV